MCIALMYGHSEIDSCQGTPDFSHKIICYANITINIYVECVVKLKKAIKNQQCTNKIPHLFQER